ncbi:MAG: ATP-dependent DNA helicase RecG [Microbacterium sp.]
MTVTLDMPLGEVIGAKDAAALKKSFEMATVADLIGHYPRRYVTRGELTPIRSLPIGDVVSIVAEVKRVSTRSMRSRGGTILEVVISDGQGEMSLTFFNQAWRQKELHVGRRGVFSGKVGLYRDQRQFSHPDYVLFDDEADTQAEAREWAEKIIPIYPATAQVRTWDLEKLILSVLDRLADVDDPMPPELRARDHLMRTHEALDAIHRPLTMTDAHRARHTLRIQEAVVMQTALLQQRAELRKVTTMRREPVADGLVARFDASQPYDLTPDQVTVGQQISTDLSAQEPMNRLVQGEVGSGKTLVALRAMLQVAESGGQSALIAPTEVLAAQHLRSIIAMLGPKLAPELLPTLLTGQMTAAERRKAALRVASGQSLIVVGTHALLSDKTTFADLGLVVVDEQHRFGVEQREALRAKGTSPHALVLTATPIPRTVAMTVFGDLDVSTIRTMPPGRAEVHTFVAPLNEKPGWEPRVWQRVAEEVAAQHQVFVVCPAIDVEQDGAQNVDWMPDAEEGEEEERRRPLSGVVQVSAMLANLPELKDLRIDILHGRMTGEQKDEVMRAFAAGAIDILVATTVIEVGVDVPNASGMIVLDGDRFGVSQLHQLRGRIGRGTVPGVCLLVTHAPEGAVSRERLDAVAATRDGFVLAEVDLQLRGEGDVLGDAQAGTRSSLRLLRVIQDADLIATARADAAAILEQDPQLDHHPELQAALRRRMTESERAALGKS